MRRFCHTPGTVGQTIAFRGLSGEWPTKTDDKKRSSVPPNVVCQATGQQRQTTKSDRLSHRTWSVRRLANKDRRQKTIVCPTQRGLSGDWPTKTDDKKRSSVPPKHVKPL